jgi:ATP-dependent HslUV protease ATP-binding subunit HslU
MNDFTPKQIVSELDKYIVGQDKAKKAVAISLRNRWRRQRVAEDMREDIYPKNIILIGPTGVGKTEIARRLARLSEAPFIKVEASKFTEVGYVGRDVESIIRDLMRISVQMVQREESEKVKTKARDIAQERVLDHLLPVQKDAEVHAESREKLRTMLKEGRLDDRIIEVEARESAMPTIEVFSGQGLEEMGIDFKEMFSNFLPKKTRRRKMSVKDALEFLASREVSRLIDMDKVTEEARHRVENTGIVFVDELDKVSGRESSQGGPDVSREGVQRDLLPIVEGTTVNTKFGPVRTDHILFIGSGAFHVSKPSDLIPELQGRFPIREELNPLTREDFVRILVEPKNALIKQYQALLATEGIDLRIGEDAIQEIARIAQYINEHTENIGARRLHTVLEKLLEEISYEGADLSGTIEVNAEYVNERLGPIMQKEDLSRYIL